MLLQSIVQRTGKWLAIAALVGGAGFVVAQSEPTLDQVYEAARAGRLEQAQVMVQQVLVAHPNSAKAHFVEAELAARQGQAGRAREALAKAEKLAPGLPFVKPEALQSLRAQLTSGSTGNGNAQQRGGLAAIPAQGAASASGFPWTMVLVGGVGVIALVAFMRRKRSLPTGGLQGGPQGGYAGPGAVQGAGLGGAQTFGAGNAPMQPGNGQPAYGQPGYGQPAYGQAPGSGLGGRIAGGLATGLAVGAGVMAAQAIGKNLMGNDEHSGRHADGAAAGDNLQPLPGNRDMGGQDFGIQDAGSWDDGGGSIADAGGAGGDWDT